VTRAPIQAAIVDLDGTLVDTLGDFVAVLALTLDELSLPVVPRAFVERTVGKGSEHLIRSGCAKSGPTPRCTSAPGRCIGATISRSTACTRRYTPVRWRACSACTTPAGAWLA
jgi:hypothetical protein